MTYALFADLPDVRAWRQSPDRRDWLDVLRAVEAEAELAAEAVRAACEAHRLARSAETDAAYRTADRRYDAARLAFMETSHQVVTGIRAIARFAREVELADATKGRML